MPKPRAISDSDDAREGLENANTPAGRRAGGAANGRVTSKTLGPDVRNQFQRQLMDLMPKKLASRFEGAAFDPSGERRALVILTWRSSLEVAQDGDLSDDIRYLIADRLMRAISEVIYTYEGLIHRYDGEQLTAVFGLPTAHENDTERAVRAAVELRT
ncbi:MAG: hypothetical protein ACP5JG_07635, partial [Anaerolineae bacterium]